ncbi:MULTISPECIES: autotransporter domain-containing protein [unclassified Sphingopyxis]|uniref:autotransporter domain-containing protein n=1 Tax=unclassified Sphingopyxis TaxID=2614943 RepID=UPI0025E6F6AC|nr:MULTISPECIES: autotransporter domain-containing protein [unclassified Sphingopyxis]
MTPALAQADASVAPTGGEGYIAATQPEPQADLVSIAGPTIQQITPEPEILIANPGTPTTARDPVNITGIGQMVVDAGGGSVGLCTGTLINPRTVLFAAHCVNTRAATAYGANSGGTAIAFGFETNTRANAPGQTDELVRWLLGGAGGAGRYQTNTAQAFYNSNWLNYNPLSLEPASRGFLYGDVAIAALDTPAANIPTWALLFSPLTNTGTIGASGTGYDVGIVGYGQNGTGQTGAAGSDFRRRSAENILGALTDLQTFEGFLFGGVPNGLTQNLYFLDFDDPRRGMTGASPFDFNAFRDNARTNPNGASLEGITSQGDSGGPLILQNAFARQVVIGVLSGGYTRFFGPPQPANSYGTVSFYQPLYLYWDWIAANNPYHYVSAKAGNGSWTDPSHWVSTIDPSYMIESGGQLVNGIPTLTGEQKDGTSGDFGQICFQSAGVSECFDTRTGVGVVENRPIGTSDDNAGSASIAEIAAGATAARDGLIPGVQPEAQAAAIPLPAATLANGLPGAMNFVPNNVDPVRTAGTAPRYFDVTLSATGLTTLSGANVTVDRLTIGTAGAALQIDSGASLSSLINVNQLAGMVTVNGTLSSVGDYSLFGGGLMGSGRINAPFLTSVLGQVAPGTPTTIGTLTVGGNLVLSSGNNLFINFGPNGTSDVLAVVPNGTLTGSATLGGAVSFSPVAGHQVTAGDRYTFLTAAGGVTGTFGSASAISAILTPRLTYNLNSVSFEIEAGLYRDVVAATAVQGAYAQLLDQSRGTAGLASVYGPLDLQNAATIRATLESWAPRTETLRGSLATVAIDNMSRFTRDRLLQLDAGDMGGTLSMIGRPVQLAQLNMTSVGADMMAVRSDSDAVTVQQGRLPEDTSAFLAGGYLDGDSRPMASALPGGSRDQFDGFYLAGGIEKALDEGSVIGFSLSYTDVDGTTPVGGQTASGSLYQGTLYGKAALGGGIELATQISAGAFDSRTTRVADLIGTPFTLTGDDTSLIFTGEVSLAKNFDLGSLEFGPRVAARASHIGFSDIKENGGGPALRLDRSNFNSLQARAGLALSGKKGSRFQPHLSADYVHEFEDAPASFGATFVGGPGPSAIFGLAGTDKDWFEVGGGITIVTGNVDLSIGADTTIGRKDVSNQSYRGSVTFHF